MAETNETSLLASDGLSKVSAILSERFDRVERMNDRDLVSEGEMTRVDQGDVKLFLAQKYKP